MTITTTKTKQRQERYLIEGGVRTGCRLLAELAIA